MSHRPLAFTAQRLLDILRSFPAVKSYRVGFSGGADSTALLHALHTIRDRLDVPVSAVHINHGLHAGADDWQAECENFCGQRDIDLVCLKIDLGKRSGKGLEAEARHLRYEAISTLLKSGDCLLTAHHADDQAETLLLNLMRGSGVDGLSAMPDSRALGNGMLQRPLLGFQNSALRDYLHEHGIDWTDDPSNQYLDHDRNFIRHEVIPRLEQRWPEVSKRLLLTRKAMMDARILLERVADGYLAEHLLHPQILQIAPTVDGDPELFKLVVRRWMKQSGKPSVPAYRLEAFCEQVRQPKTNHNVTVHWDECVLHLYRQQLWLHDDRAISACPTVDWPEGATRVDLGADIGHLVMESPAPPELQGKLSVVGRGSSGGSTISQGGHHKSLKNLFQSAGIPLWLRDCIPLCKLDNKLVAIGDWCFDQHFSDWMSENNTRLRWDPRNPLLKFVHDHQNPDMVDPAGAVR
jgi:tRNA(Ile)-lysidine synthase